jgi:hypothetical protein
MAAVALTESTGRGIHRPTSTATRTRRSTSWRGHNAGTDPVRMILTFTPAGMERFFEETLERALDPPSRRRRTPTRSPPATPRPRPATASSSSSTSSPPGAQPPTSRVAPRREARPRAPWRITASWFAANSGRATGASQFIHARAVRTSHS